jgi:hypothetical protein
MSSTANLDQAALNNLTPEERKAFDEPEYSASELEAMKKLAGDDGDDDGADDGDPNEVLDANGKPVEVPAAAEPAKDDDAPPAADTAPVVAEADAPRAQSPYKATLPEDFDARVQGLGEAETTAWAQFEDGALDRPALQAELRRIETERAELNGAKLKVDIAQEMSQQQAAQQWESAINSLFKSAKAEGIDYKADQDRNAELDQFVKVLANNPAHQDKSMDWFLTEAHKRVMVLNGKTVQAAAPAKPAAQNRTPPAPPKTIAHIPGGDGPGDVGGEFAHLDALDGNDLEAAIARMTPAAREKYSRGG